MSADALGPHIFPHTHVVLRHSSGGPLVIARARYGANRLPGELEHFVLCRIDDYRDGRVWATAEYGADHRVILVIRGRPRVSSALFAGPDPSIADFAASALGALFGGLTAALLARFLWRGIFRRRLI